MFFLDGSFLVCRLTLAQGQQGTNIGFQICYEKSRKFILVTQSLHDTPSVTEGMFKYESENLVNCYGRRMGPRSRDRWQDSVSDRVGECKVVGKIEWMNATQERTERYKGASIGKLQHMSSFLYRFIYCSLRYVNLLQQTACTRTCAYRE